MSKGGQTMAKNWKVGEAVRAIQGGNKEDILDIGRRFPLFANLAAQVNEAGASLLDCVPEYCSARKIESVLKGDVQETEDNEEEAEDIMPAPKKEKAEKKAPAKAEKKAPKKAPKEEVEEDDEDGDELESKSAKELYEMCKEAGLKVKPKQDKSVYIEALKAADEEEADEEWEEEEEEPAPKKAPKKEAKGKKAPKKEEDDDDWEI